MARYTGAVEAPHSAEEVWHYLAEMRAVEEWDPSVDSVSVRDEARIEPRGLRERLRKPELGGPIVQVRG